MKILNVESAKIIRSCSLLSEKTSERNSKQFEDFLHAKVQKQLLKDGYCKLSITESNFGQIAKEYEERKKKEWEGICAYVALTHIQQDYQEAGYYTGLTDYAEQIADETTRDKFTIVISPFPITGLKLAHFDFYEPKRKTTWQDEEKDF